MRRAHPAIPLDLLVSPHPLVKVAVLQDMLPDVADEAAESGDDDDDGEHTPPARHHGDLPKGEDGEDEHGENQGRCHTEGHVPPHARTLVGGVQAADILESGPLKGFQEALRLRDAVTHKELVRADVGLAPGDRGADQLVGLLVELAETELFGQLSEGRVGPPVAHGDLHRRDYQGEAG